MEQMYSQPTALTITVDAKGIAKAAGRIDGLSVSGSSSVMLIDGSDDMYIDFVFYNARVGTISVHVDLEWWLLRESDVFGDNAISNGSYDYVGDCPSCYGW